MSGGVPTRLRRAEALGHPLVSAGLALVLAGAALLAAHLHRPPPRTEWAAFALWFASLAATVLACRTPRAALRPALPLTREDVGALAAIAILSAALLLPWLAVYPLEMVGDPVGNSGLRTRALATGEATIFQYGFRNASSFVLPLTDVPFYLVFGPSSLSFKGLSAVLGLLTPILLYLLARRYLSRPLALAAAVFLLTLPVYLFFARTEPEVAWSPLLMVAILAALLRVEEEEARPRTLALLGLVTGVTVHFHAAVKVAGLAGLGLALAYALALALLRRQRWRRLWSGAALAVAGFLIGLGPLILVSNPALVVSSGHLVNLGAVGHRGILGDYQRSLRVFLDQPTQSWFPTQAPVIPTPLLSALFVLGATLGLFAAPRRLQSTLLFFLLLLPLTNSALTDLINAEHRLAPLFPVAALLGAMGLGVLVRAVELVRWKTLRIALLAALALAFVVAVALQARAFFVDEQGRRADLPATYLMYHALREIERTPALESAGELCVMGSPWLREQFDLVHYRRGWDFYRAGQTIRLGEIAGAVADNEIFLSASCERAASAPLWQTRVVCSPRRRYVCPGPELPQSELRIHVDPRPGPPPPAGGVESAAPKPTVERSLPDAERVREGRRSLSPLTRLDLNELRGNGAVEIEVNDPEIAGRLASAFDGDTRWIVRGGGVNPLVLAFDFAQPVKLAAARLLPGAAPHSWLVQVGGGTRRMRPSVPAGEWSQIDLDPSVPTTSVRIEILRLERDDYVHLYELELYTGDR